LAPEITRTDFKPQRTDHCFCGSGQRFKNCCGRLSEPRQPPHGLHIIQDFLSPEHCDHWVSVFEQQQREFVQIVDHNKSTPTKTVLRRDDARVTERVDAGPLKNEVYSTIQKAIESDISRAVDRQFSWFIGPQVLRYTPGGHYALHADSDHWSGSTRSWVKGLDRDISLLLYLNDDFSGGELSFPLFNYTYRPRPGDLLFFPSDFRYRHQAHPVSAGLRYVVVSWAAYRDEPRVQEHRPQNRVELPI
jgi:predicted 2-oxoglutarate/Fe(II)-dependent dioxygenase YbiX